MDGINDTADTADAASFIEPASASDDHASIGTTDHLAITSDYDPTLHHHRTATSTTAGASLVGSLTDSVTEHVFENGRRYHRYKSGRYPIPNDDMEASRENVRNALFSELLGGQLHLAPLARPQHIMDVGTGFGDWAVEAGDRYPSARVVGLDLSPIQSVWIPPNVEFVVDDVEDNAWIHGSDVDFFHFRMVAVVLKDPAAVARTAFANLRPGGWIEFQEVYPRIACQDGDDDGGGGDDDNNNNNNNNSTRPPGAGDDYVVARFYRLAARVLRRRYGWDLFAAGHLPRQLQDIGFVRVQRRVCHVPIGYWPKDPRRMQQAFLLEETLTEFMAAMQAKPFSGGIDLAADEGEDGGARVVMSADEVDALCHEVRAALRAKHVHAYIPFHFIWAQKPEQPPSG
ncbi:hypothetical protein HMPREF1624_04133 [Sporothrix schenckii ATCC 58251]|uniref:Methyltransferase domain-containing protein n=1 Tax=Sporothrix schenckii (strain ATCC 58251 / de Perez 2211183) TaxID=1391915 RepID=U7PWV8_SPOS1|nr:hypothetical protein HMPREF1624_04133 [Sporothrix schenckii ATCC 58251]